MKQLLYFSASWCAPCRVMKPHVQVIAERFPEVEIRQIDIDEGYETATEHGIRSVPTFIHLRDGEEVARVVGSRTREDLIRELSL